MSRGQSHVVGVAVMLGLTVVALGGLTVAVGGLMEAQAATADADRVADSLARELRPVETTGVTRGRLHLGGGHLETVERTVRLRRNGTTILEADAGGLRYRSASHRATVTGGAVLRGAGGGGWAVTEPPVAAGEDPPVLVVGLPVIRGEPVSLDGHGGAIPVRTNVTHSRQTLGPGTYTLAIETRWPDALAPALQDQGARITSRDIDGDGVPSVVARFPGRRRGFLVRHTLRLEVGHG